MRRSLAVWTVEELSNRIHEINFPEYQREPTVWNLDKKQRLIDSIIRGFDIASIYFYRFGEAEFDCIDGRQRINAIMSFLGKNDLYQAEDNGFRFKRTNEIFDDGNKFNEIDGRRFSDDQFEPWRITINKYVLNIVEVTDIEEAEELNLLFLRLQLGSILNSGEKLHAMTGDMRDFIFEELGGQPFFSSISIPYRRFAREQVAAQIACQIFNLRDAGFYVRTRYLDLQVFFKKFKQMNDEDRVVAEDLIRTSQALIGPLGDNIGALRNRALTVSGFLYAHDLISEGEENRLELFVRFYIELLSRLYWQIPKGLEMDREYHNLERFQKDVTQASVERSAVERRHDFILRYFTYYLKHEEIMGDKNYKARTGNEPGIG